MRNIGIYGTFLLNFELGVQNLVKTFQFLKSSRLNEETIQNQSTTNDQPVTPSKAQSETLISAYFEVFLILI